ncbi:uncharacterized protein A4U43_C01F12430 [Asparagus officinalis]|uniref:Uncharacterized protein n=1 Tax=Asparagus officinalis TaxID=4686 RepID=A0A5P1FNS4_ASPOF|nr:uncharacterized protein A4U43_C01F12430 [Asparagus officinalis]
MCYSLTNREDSVKIGILKHRGGFPQEGLFGTNIIGLRPGFVNKDAPVNIVVVAPNTFGNELAKIDAQYLMGRPGSQAGLERQIPSDDKEKQVDYRHDDTDAYLTKPNDVGDLGDISYSADNESDFWTMDEAMPTSIPASNCFEPVTYFEGASSVLVSFNNDDNILVFPVLAEARRVVLLSPKPCSDEGPSVAAATLDELEISSMGVKVVPMDVPMTTTVVVRIMISSIVSYILVTVAPYLMSSNERIQVMPTISLTPEQELELNLVELTKKWDSQVT